MMDIRLFQEILEIDSTSGKERGLSDFLALRLQTGRNKVERYDVPSMVHDTSDECSTPQNLLFSWGLPEIIFCTHLDTVPPYIYPSVVSSDNEGSDIKTFSGRGTCDAKGQIFAMWEACKELERKGCDGFGLLLLAGEETGSFGAKAFNAMVAEDPVLSQTLKNSWVVVGEPTDNFMASAAKGTKAFEVTFTGKSFHSGYPEYGISAVELFNDFMNALRSIGFPKDPELGATTWNIGRLISDNPQNILSESLTCRVYFRTTFASDEMVCNIMKNIAGPDAKLRFERSKVQDGSDIVAKEVALWQKSMSVKALGGDTPSHFEVIEGFQSKPVAFGSDAPQLSCFAHKILCGPGSILTAHRDDEHITMAALQTAVKNYIKLYEIIHTRKG